MGSSGYVNWHKLDRMLPWVRHRAGSHTYVYAFWMVDYAGSDEDTGVQIFKKGGQHPDWFIHATTADHVLDAYPHPKTLVSPNFEEVFTSHLKARPLLGSLLLGSTDTAYQNGGVGQMWWCAAEDLNFRGRQVLKQLDRLYERPAILVTFVDWATDENGGPRDSRS